MCKVTVNFSERVLNRVNNTLNYDNAAALERFEKAVIGLAELTISFKLEAQRPIAKVSAQYSNKREEIKLYLNQEILDYIFEVLYGQFKGIEQIDATNYEDFKCEEGLDFGFEIFKNEIEIGKIMTFKNDFVTPKGDHYLCTESNYMNRNKVRYCIKRTPEVEQYLTDKELNK